MAPRNKPSEHTFGSRPANENERFVTNLRFVINTQHLSASASSPYSLPTIWPSSERGPSGVLYS